MYMIRVEYELNSNTFAHILGEDQLFYIGEDWECQQVIFLQTQIEVNF